MNADDEFFIGYAPPMPPHLARFVRRVVLVLGCGALAWGATVAAGHVSLESGTFEFGHPRQFAGTIVEQPYPALRLDAGDQGASWLLLVAPGKHGAGALVHGLGGRHVTLTGTRVRRGKHAMIEVDPASIVVQGALKTSAAADKPEETSNAGPVRVRGEIVDSKCFLGVMVPGSGKTHKDCASLCLRGGIPPALYVKDRSGESAVLLLTGSSGESITAHAVEDAGEAIDMTGTVQRVGGWLVLQTSAVTWSPVRRQE